jgi:plastocyanin
LIRRALAGAAIAAAALPGVASAAVARPIQAVDSGGRSFWVSNDVKAQQGDTIDWRLTQPGNAAAAAHDVWLIAPGGSDGSAQQLATAGLSTSAHAPLDQVGTYRFYCNVHGGLAPGGMNGTITVGVDDPGAPVDPGTPWTAPPPPVIDGSPLPAANPFPSPAVFELGDVQPPSVEIERVTGIRHGARVRLRASEAGTVTVKLLLGRRVAATRRIGATGATQTVTIRPKARIKTSRLRVQVTATDRAELQSAPELSWVWVGG